jgi:hypothetical protein
MANRPRNPCQANSRWKKHSFFVADSNAAIVVTMHNSTSYLFSIDGIPRTVVSSFQGKFSNGTVANLPAGNYTLTWRSQEYVGGAVSMYFGNDWFSLVGGNPRLYLPQSIIDQYNTTIKTLQLPDRQFFQDVAPEKHVYYEQPQFYVGGGIRSKVNITDPKCQKMTGTENLIGVFPNNDQWYYDARIVLDQNTMEKPIADGGGLLGTFCSNVAKNFKNRK